MILVDSSIWIDHLRRRDEQLSALLEAGQVMTHAFVVGELALGNIAGRTRFLQLLDDLPQAQPATDAEVRAFIENHALAGRGIGYADTHLLAAARLNAAPLWTRDKRLAVMAGKLELLARTQ
ncbi:MAG: PIN domain-containing protein [Pseudoxanthomonas sp.]